MSTFGELHRRGEGDPAPAQYRRVRTPRTPVVGFVVLTEPGLVQDRLGTLAPALDAGLPAVMNVATSIFGGGSVHVCESSGPEAAAIYASS